MRYLDLSFATPEENLACDEVLLEAVESGRRDEVLRFWESPVPFVVVGVAQALRDEVYEDACRRDRIPMMRRCSGGGCVLQGPGCLNFVLVLAYEKHPEIHTLRGSYGFILGRIAGAFRSRGIALEHEGVADLAVRGRKVSGNAQRRKRNAMLHHGTLLYGMGHEGMGQYLREPSARPDYRGERSHESFVERLDAAPETLRDIVRDAFGVVGPADVLDTGELEAVRGLAQEKYASFEWTYRR